MSKPRKPKGRPVSGWLILDKPVDFGSTEAVSKIKWLFKAQKCGHAGTLDPLASGALPIALGEATKTVPYVQDGRKVYRFTVQWGIETDTDDADGKPVATSEERPDRATIEAALPAFTGEIMQRPPAYSAIKVDGNRAYDLARDGEEVVLQERPVSIHRLDLVEIPDRDHAVSACERNTAITSGFCAFTRRAMPLKSAVSGATRMSSLTWMFENIIPAASISREFSP